MQAAVSVIRNSEVVRYPGAATVVNIWRYRLVHNYSSVRYLVEVYYWECPLIESPLYTQNPDPDPSESLVKVDIMHGGPYLGNSIIRGGGGEQKSGGPNLL